MFTNLLSILFHAHLLLSFIVLRIHLIFNPPIGSLILVYLSFSQNKDKNHSYLWFSRLWCKQHLCLKYSIINIGLFSINWTTSKHWSKKEAANHDVTSQRAWSQQSFFGWLPLSITLDFCSVIARQFNLSQKFTIYVKPNVECHILVLKNLLILDL